MDGKITAADFFCGAGGFSEGFRQAGFDVVFALDNWKPAVETHKLNHPECNTVQLDILKLDTPEKIDQTVPDADVIIGSPPCVSFSGSNKAGKADKSLGVQLIESYLRIILWKKSKGALKYWLMENVPNSSNYTKDKYTWNELGLPGTGPDLEIKNRNVFNAANYGAPQTRNRFVCGDYPFPKETHEKEEWKTYKEVFSALGDPNTKNNSPIKDPNFDFTMDAKHLTDHYYNTTVAEFEWKKAKRQKVDHGFCGKMDFPERLDRPSRTVMATLSASTRESMLFKAKGKPNETYRLPTIREISSLMSFPINYQFEASNETSKYRLVGNAVCVKLSAGLAKAIAEKEGIAPPKKFIPLPNRTPSVNLNGSKRDPKPERTKPSDAKFETHVPYIKIKGMRVQLSNQESDFSKNKINWTSKIHYGPAKTHSHQQIENERIEKAFNSHENFPSFKSDIERTFSSLPGRSEFQKIYAERDKTGMSPERALDTIKEKVDKHFPEEEFKDLSVTNSNALLENTDSDIPVRVLAAFFACNFLVSQLKQ